MQIPGQGFLVSPRPRPCNFLGLRRSYTAATVMSHEVSFFLPHGNISLLCVFFFLFDLKALLHNWLRKEEPLLFLLPALFYFLFNNDAIARNTLQSNLWEIKVC